MTNEDLKKAINFFLETNRPPVCMKAGYHVIFRDIKLMLVKSTELRLGDIRIVQLDAVDFVKGLSPEQWTCMLMKIQALTNVLKVDLFSGKESD